MKSLFSHIIFPETINFYKLLFFALLFFSVTPTHSMGLVRAIKQRVKSKPQPQAHAQLCGGACAQACAQSAFAQTGFSPELLALVLVYCSSEFNLGVITLPDVKKKKNATFKYPKHSAVQVNLEGDILTVLTTANQLLKYQLPDGVLISQSPANLAAGGIYVFECIQYLKVDDWTVTSKDGSVFVADSIVCPLASSEKYLAHTVGDLSELKVNFSIPYREWDKKRDNRVSGILVSKKYGYAICAIRSPAESHAAHGYCYYDNSKLKRPLKGKQQPCTTIEVSLQPRALARMLGFELAKHDVVQEDMQAAQVSQHVAQQEDEKKEEELAGQDLLMVEEDAQLAQALAQIDEQDFVNC